MQAICAKCINVKINGDSTDAHCFYCKKHPIPKTKSPVTGLDGYFLSNGLELSKDRAFHSCDHYNQKGECKDFFNALGLDSKERLKK